MKTIQIEVPSRSGPRTYPLDLPDDCSQLSQVLVAVSLTNWGQDLVVRESGELRPRPHLLLVLNRRMIQPWEIEGTEILEGQAIQLIPIVPGG